MRGDYVKDGKETEHHEQEENQHDPIRIVAPVAAAPANAGMPSKLATAAIMRRIRIHLIIKRRSARIICVGITRKFFALFRQPACGQEMRHVPDLAWQHGAEGFPRDAFGVQRGIKPVAGFTDRFVGEVERAPVAAGGKGGIAEQHAFDSLFRVLMLRLHEPARLVSTDRQYGEAERAVFPGHLAIILAAEKSGISGDKYVSRRRFDRETAPQRHAAVARAARRPVMRRLDMER